MPRLEKKRGQPSPYRGRELEIAKAIAIRMEAGETLNSICSGKGMPSVRSVNEWRESNREIGAIIARARIQGFDAIAEETLKIADTPQEGVETTIEEDGSVTEKRGDMLGHRKLQIETRLKLLAKWDPKRYGDTDKTTVNVGVAVNNITVSETERAELMARKKAAAERARLAEG